MDTSRVFRPGESLALRISGSDKEPAATSLEALSRNHILRPRPYQVTIHQSPDLPSRLDIPVTRGNIMGTFMSGGDISQFGFAG